MYSVGHNNSFVIVRREGNFINFFGINHMTMTSYDIHFSVLFLLAKQTLSKVIELNAPFCNILCHLVTFFIFGAIKQFVRVKGSPQTNKFHNLLPISFILKHSEHFTIKSCFNSRRMISRVVTSVKQFLNVGVDIFVKIFGPSCNESHASMIYSNQECSYQYRLAY